MSSAIEVELRSKVSLKPLSLVFLEKTCRRILGLLGWRRVSVSLIFVGNREIQKFNHIYLRHNRPTDVIAFRQFQKRLSPKRACFLGDVMISVPMARKQAREYGTAFQYELCFYLCHGVLHLMGYRDKTKQDSLVMERKQKQILKRLGIDSN